MSIPQEGGGPVSGREDLVRFIASGEKPKADWRIGTEHEKFGYRLADRKPLPYRGACSVKAMLDGLADRFGWERILEGENVIGLKKGAANVSLEPGGQLELSGAPLKNLHHTCEELNQHLAEVKSIADEIGAGFLGVGAAPEWRHEDMDVMPKGRYGLMTAYMPKVGTHGLQMMYRTCTVQANLDFGSEPDMVQKMRVAIALQPVATALFASSPFFEGKVNGFQSWRARIWRDVDRARSGMLPFVFEDGFGYERYVDYALDVPMYFVYRQGRYIDATGQSFRDFLDGRLPAMPGEKPTLSDWADHLTTIFPEARLKKFIEMRGADGGPWRRICALPAFWVGLIYDQAALDAAWEVCRGWTAEERETLRADAAVHGLRATIRGRSLREVAAELLEIAGRGLSARAVSGVFDRDEGHFLNALRDTVERGETLADEMLRKYETEWKGDLSRLYAEFSY